MSQRLRRSRSPAPSPEPDLTSPETGSPESRRSVRFVSDPETSLAGNEGLPPRRSRRVATRSPHGGISSSSPSPDEAETRASRSENPRAPSSVLGTPSGAGPNIASSRTSSSVNNNRRITRRGGRRSAHGVGRSENLNTSAASAQQSTHPVQGSQDSNRAATTAPSANVNSPAQPLVQPQPVVVIGPPLTQCAWATPSPIVPNAISCPVTDLTGQVRLCDHDNHIPICLAHTARNMGVRDIRWNISL